MSGSRAPALLLLGLVAVSPAMVAGELRDVTDLPGVEALAAAAATHPDDYRTLELDLLAAYRRGDDEGILRTLRDLAARKPGEAASLHETLAGLYLRDRRLYRSGQHLAAIPPARRTPQVIFFEANIAARQRDLETALARLNELSRRVPHDPIVARDQAQIASLVGDHATAAAACERILRVRPADEDAQFRLARARMLQGRRADAEARLATLLARNPRHGLAALDLGLLQLARGDLRAAQASFVKARSVEGQDPAPYVAEATTALLLGRRAEARKAVAGAVKQNAGDPLVGLLDVLVRGTTSSPLVAATSPSAAASLYPDLERALLPPDLLGELGPAPVAGRVAAASLLLQLWSPAAAHEWFAAQSSAAPAGPLAEMTAIRVLVSAGDLQAARRRVARLEAAPAGRGLAGPSVQAAEVAARLGDREGALRAMQRALAAAPELPRLRMLAGDLYNALRQPREAVTQYRAALQGLPGDARLLNQLAATMASTGPRTEYEEALRLAEEGLRHRPHYLLRAYLLDTRADLLHRLGRTAEAYAAYRELSTTVGGITGPDAWHRLGELALAAGDLGDARRSFEEALDYGRDYPLRARAVEQVVALPASPPQK